MTDAKDQRPHLVVPITAEEMPGVVEVLCDAFHHYPVMRHVLAESEGDYSANLSTLIGFFVGARVWRGEPVVGIREAGELVAAAIMTPPGQSATPRELLDHRERMWQQLGDEAKARYNYLGVVWPKVGVSAPNLHLNMIGVRRDKGGLGLGRAILDTVHDMSADNPESTGVSLTTETPVNVPFYQRRGYQVVAHEHLVGDMKTWGMFRPDEAVV